MADRSAAHSPLKTILLVGFGGLLLLVAFAGWNALDVLRRIQTSNDEISADFLARNRTLNELRSSLYLSGTYVRDYLIDRDASQAEGHRRELEATQTRMRAALAGYGQHLRSDEAAPFHGLERALDEYWRVLAPVLTWGPAERQARADAFLRHEVYPRRAGMLQLADQIAMVNEAQLNAGRQRVADLFSTFGQRLVLTLAVTLGLGALLAAVSIAHTLALEREARARYLEIERARTELRALSARLLETQENERRAISRELHDEVGQTLSAVIVELSNVTTVLPENARTELRAHIEAIKRLVENTMGMVRNMALLLRPSMLDDIGLVPAVRWQARELARRTGMRVDVAADEGFDDLPDEYKTCVYRIVQEALRNSERHAQANVCRITLRTAGRQLQIEIQDDGKGFDLKLERGLGLLGIHERVERLGGQVRVESAPQKGTRVAVDLPRPIQAAAEALA